ncbi:hypothetical protein M8J77_024116 [Diaphorina citri]|nr:hypothetical protein M8J77_024116 [Diaphorina citri]
MKSPMRRKNTPHTAESDIERPQNPNVEIEFDVSDAQCAEMVLDLIKSIKEANVSTTRIDDQGKRLDNNRPDRRDDRADRRDDRADRRDDRADRRSSESIYNDDDKKMKKEKPDRSRKSRFSRKRSNKKRVDFDMSDENVHDRREEIEPDRRVRRPDRHSEHEIRNYDDVFEDITDDDCSEFGGKKRRKKRKRGKTSDVKYDAKLRKQISKSCKKTKSTIAKEFKAKEKMRQKLEKQKLKQMAALGRERKREIAQALKERKKCEKMKEKLRKRNEKLKLKELEQKLAVKCKMLKYGDQMESDDCYDTRNTSVDSSRSTL